MEWTASSLKPSKSQKGPQRTADTRPVLISPRGTGIYLSTLVTGVSSPSLDNPFAHYPLQDLFLASVDPEQLVQREPLGTGTSLGVSGNELSGNAQAQSKGNKNPPRILLRGQGDKEIRGTFTGPGLNLWACGYVVAQWADVGQTMEGSDLHLHTHSRRPTSRSTNSTRFQVSSSGMWTGRGWGQGKG